MSKWIPNGLIGWVGVGVLLFALIYHRALSTIGLLIAVVVGLYLYLQLDSGVSATASAAA